MIINMELLFSLNELNVKSNSTLRIKLAIEMLWINPVTKLKKKQITQQRANPEKDQSCSIIKICSIISGTFPTVGINHDRVLMECFVESPDGHILCITCQLICFLLIFANPQNLVQSMTLALGSHRSQVSVEQSLTG